MSSASWLPMTADRWAQLSPLIDAALDLPLDQRPAYFARFGESDRTLVAEVEHLVRECERADDMLDVASAERLELLNDAEATPGVTDAATLTIRDQLQASLGSAFTIERELGGGGMSRVFVAHETSLDRKVVVKLLAPALAAGLSAERFEREIRLAASLQQANIVPLLSAGRAGALPYYTMPYVAGRSLREHLAREGALPIRDAVNLLRDVARALAFAHEQGVVHRDIKPGNVLLSGGTAVVTDFGIAKALTAARGDAAAGGADPDPLTETGVGIGTRAYMAPEQAAGDPAIDHRADIYAFGCLAFEVLTGKPPFHGALPHEVVASHFRDTPQPVSLTRADTPPAIVRLVAQCLEKSPARRPQSAVQLLTALDAVSETPLNGTRPRGHLLLLGTAVIASVVIVATGYVFWRGAPGRTQTATTRTTVGTTNTAALEQYQLGQALVRQRGAGVKKGVAYLEHAIALDPEFARAHAALATALELYPYFVGTAPSEVRDRASNAARLALQLDSTLAEAHSALGEIHATDAQWNLATPEFERALALEPDSTAARLAYARLEINRGEVDDALSHLEQARRLAPVSPLVSAWQAYALFLSGRVDEALAEHARAVQLDSTLLPVTNLGALMHVARGDTAGARRLIVVPRSAGVMSNAPYVYARLGDTATAWKLVHAMEANDPRPWFTDVATASVRLALGDTARALGALEQAEVASGPIWIAYIPVRDPAWDPVRHSARFTALVARAGLKVSSITGAGASPSPAPAVPAHQSRGPRAGTPPM